MKENADYVCGIIAHNLKNFREKQKLSMDQLAALSGVSKSMIGQIERAETNTSISTLWKIASGLHIPFTSLIEHDRESVTLVIPLLLRWKTMPQRRTFFRVCRLKCR